MATQRTTPMQVICLGMCRTGTQSLADALIQLGITPIYHMREVHKNNHSKYWLPLLEKKFSVPPQAITREEFDEFLWDYAGVTDVPAAIFASDLLSAYPEAKIILTVRDEEKWLSSMKATLWHAQTSEFTEKMFRYVFGQDRKTWDWEGMKVFLEHNKSVLKAAKEAGREVLIYEVKEGWGPVCKFLGVKIPEGSFPRSDDWAQYKKENQVKDAGR